jgi:hypothetical protein
MSDKTPVSTKSEDLRQPNALLYVPNKTTDSKGKQ